MNSSPSSAISADSPIRLERERSERPLFFLVLITALVLWAVICVSVVGLVYGIVLGVFFFATHVAFIAHLRGSAVRLTISTGPRTATGWRARTTTLRTGDEAT